MNGVALNGSLMMTTLQSLTFTILVGLVLSACTPMPNPVPSRPWVGADGKVVQPPPEGWPDYTRGGGADMGGARN